MNQERHIKHLYWRACFGLGAADWQIKKEWSIDQAVDDLFESIKRAQPWVIDRPVEPIRPGKMSAMARKQFNKNQRELGIQLNTDWMSRMSDDKGSPFLERMTLFWHGHFACEPKVGFLIQQQMELLRMYALGNFKDLLLGVAQDPAMIRYLNNQQNKKNAPNENFARELLELFTIGRGHYTEQDIKEAARAFTGWSSNLKGEFVFRRFQHDYDSKSFMGKTGNFDGEDIIDIILAKKETAYFITKKIYRYFVNDQIDEQIVNDLSQKLYQSNYHIGDLMRHIFTSDWFYKERNMGSKIKSPTDLLAGIMKHVQLTLANPRELLKIQRGLGQTLFRPPNVAGWPGGKSWIDNSTLMLRLSIPGAIYGASDIAFQLKAELEKEDRQKLKKLQAKTDLKPIQNMVSGLSNMDSVEQLSDYLLSSKPRLSKVDILKYVNKKSPETFISTLCLRLMTMPEYQMC